jgi:hypothetical protein
LDSQSLSQILVHNYVVDMRGLEMTVSDTIDLNSGSVQKRDNSVWDRMWSTYSGNNYVPCHTISCGAVRST